MTTLNFDEAAELFTWKHKSAKAVAAAAAGQPARGHARSGHSTGMTYKRFATGAEAIRFAIEELPPQGLAVTVLESEGERFDHDAIRTLYDSPGFPLPRKAA